VRRRRHDFVRSLVASCHWAVFLVLAVAVYGLLRWFVPSVLPRDTLGHAMGSASVLLAPYVALIAALPAPFALWRGYRESRLIEDLSDIESLRAIEWSDLEMLVRAVYERQGYSARRLGGFGADGGVDVVLKRDGKKLLVQCKQWRARQVSVNVVRELLGAVTSERADAGVVVTCGTFTGDAWGFASANGLELVDGMRLLELVRQVQRVPRAPASPAPASAQLIDAGTGPLPCPSCGGRMVRRQAVRGPNRGSAFFGCTRYPVCKGTRPM
jgi:restriction system protein